MKNNYDFVSDFYEDIALVLKNNKLGIIDKEGELILPPTKYTYVGSVSKLNEEFINGMKRDGLIVISIDGKFGFIDKTGKEIIPIIYDQINYFYGDLYIVKKDEKFGLIDKGVKQIVPMIYDSINSIPNNGKYDYATNTISYPVDGYYQVTKGDKFGFINYKGVETVPVEYDYDDYTIQIDEDVISVSKNGKWGIINMHNEVVVPFVYDSIKESRGLGVFPAMKNDAWGIIDKTGKEIAPLIYDDAYNNFSDFSVVQKDEKFGGIDPSGKLIIELIYDEFQVDPYDGEPVLISEGIFSVKKDGKWGHLAVSGKEITPTIYDSAGSFRNGTALVRVKDKIGRVNANGDEVIPCKYGKLQAFEDDKFFIASTKKGFVNNKTNGVINNKGEIVVPLEYEFISPLSITNLVGVMKDDKVGCIDLFTKKDIIPIIYDRIGTLDNEHERKTFATETGETLEEKTHPFLLRVLKDEKVGVFDKTGKTIIPIEYDAVNPITEGDLWLFELVKEGKLGIMNESGKLILPLEFDDKAVLLKRGILTLEKNGTTFSFNQEGTKIENV